LEVRIPNLIDDVFTCQIQIGRNIGFDMGEKVKNTLLERPAFGPVICFDLKFFNNTFDIFLGEERDLSDMIVMFSDTVFTACCLLALAMLKHAKLDDGLSMLALVHFP
jgi:hypothetical protein